MKGKVEINAVPAAPTTEYCAVEWRVNGSLDTTDADNIDVTTWCSSAREFLPVEEGFAEASIEIEFDALTCYSFTPGTLYNVKLSYGDPLSTAYNITSAVYVGQSAENPVDNKFEAVYKFNRKFSV